MFRKIVVRWLPKQYREYLEIALVFDKNGDRATSPKAAKKLFDHMLKQKLKDDFREFMMAANHCSGATLSHYQRIADMNEAGAVSSDQQVFEKLKSLAGKWKRDGDLKLELVDFRLSARDSVIVETWTWPDRGIEALTLYHMDGERLMATHYCPIGNQPKLLFDSDLGDSKIVFKFDSATNLQDTNMSHCVEFWMQLDDEDLFTRSETYTEKDGLDITTSKYKRVN